MSFLDRLADIALIDVRRWLHTTSGYTNCYTGNTWDATYCPDPTTCAQNCALDGADYSGTYGITTTGTALTLAFKTGSNVGSRVYLMDSSDSKYEMFNLLNKEFTFDVDMSNLPCGLNGALYFSEMDRDGSKGRFSGNTVMILVYLTGRRGLNNIKCYTGWRSLRFWIL